jgi:peptidoglycan/LPS O-acetylase OafA/YrhL
MAYYHLDKVPVLSWRQFARLGLFAIATFWVSKRAIGEVNTVSMLLTVGVSVLLLRNLPERDWGWANLGSFSYSLYVFHYAGLVLAVWLVTRLGFIPGEITNPIAWILVVPPLLAACFVLYWVTERPCNRLLERIRTL